MQRLIAVALACLVIGSSATAVAAERDDRPKERLVVSQTNVTFQVVPGSLNLAVGDFDYVGVWSGQVSGDIEGKIEGTQNGTIDFNQNMIKFTDTWTITGKGGAKIEGTDDGVSMLKPPPYQDNLAATYSAQSKIVSGDKSYTRFAGCAGTETGNYYLHKSDFLFSGMMKGELHLSCTKDEDKDNKDDDEKED